MGRLADIGYGPIEVSDPQGPTTRTAKSLSAWLAPAFADLPPLPVLHGERAGVRGSQGRDAHLELRPDLDSIEALSIEREALWTRIDKATFLSQNEKRAEPALGLDPRVGYGPVDGGDALETLRVRSPLHSREWSGNNDA